MIKLGDRYLDGGVPTSGYLAGVFDELTDAGLLALADPDPHGREQVTLTTAGHIRYTQLLGTQRRADRPVPDPQFPTAKAPAGRRTRHSHSPAADRGATVHPDP